MVLFQGVQGIWTNWTLCITHLSHVTDVPNGFEAAFSSEKTKFKASSCRSAFSQGRPYAIKGQTRSIVLLSIQFLSSALRNFISSRTTVSACSYFAEFSMIGQSVPHIRRRGP